MSTTENSSTVNTEWDSTNTNQTSNETIDLTNYVTKEEYTNAQSFGTKARQAEIAMATKLAQKDSAELHSLEDPKVKDAVTKQLLWMSYAEASAVLGANFSVSKSTSDEGGDNAGTNSNIERELKLLRFKDEQREVEYAIAAYESANPSFFSWDASAMKERIREELQNISTSLPVEERIRRAATVSLWNPIDKQSLAYQLLLNGTAWSPRGATDPQEAQKTNTERIQAELRELWGLPPKK